MYALFRLLEKTHNNGNAANEDQRRRKRCVCASY
jgi:hypothetical protein